MPYEDYRFFGKIWERKFEMLTHAPLVWWLKIKKNLVTKYVYSDLLAWALQVYFKPAQNTEMKAHSSAPTG